MGSNNSTSGAVPSGNLPRVPGLSSSSLAGAGCASQCQSDSGQDCQRSNVSGASAYERDSSLSYVQSNEELDFYLSSLLDLHPNVFNQSVVKIKIRIHFGKILSETVFHETKLLDLMQAKTNVCRISKLNKGYWVERAN